VPSSYFRSIAPRPKQMYLGTEKIQSFLSYTPATILDGLHTLKAHKEELMESDEEVCV